MATKLRQDSFDEVLGFGPGDEDGGGDVQGEAVELLLAGEVLDGLVGEAAKDEAVVGGVLFCGEGAGRVGVQRGARDAQQVQQQQFGVATRIGAQIGRSIELSGGSREGFAESQKNSSQLSVLSCQAIERPGCGGCCRRGR